MRQIALLVGLVAAGAVVSSACVQKIDTVPPGSGPGGNTGAGGGGTGGQAPALEELYGSGSRLQAVYEDAGGGAERFLHFYDSELAQSCNFAQGADASPRCAPQRMATLSYTDASCTDPVVVVSSCEPALPAHISVQPEGACIDSNMPRLDAYTVGAASTATAVYFADASGSCVPDGTFDATVDSAFEIAAADEGLFAGATVTAVEVDGGLGQRVATADDGAFRVLGAYNLARDENCAGTDVGDETLCLSANLAYGGPNYSSASCAAQDIAYTVRGGECGEPQAVLKYTAAMDQCEPATVTVHAVGDSVDAAAVYTDASGACTLTTMTDLTYFEIGGEAMKGVLPTLAEASTGDGRLTFMTITTPDGAPVGQRTGPYMDTVRNEACSRITTAEGDKCIQSMPMYPDTGTGYFSDALCTVQVVNVATAVCAIEPPTQIGLFGAAAGTCASLSVETVFALGAEYTGAVYQDDGTGACVMGTYEGIDFYAFGAEIPLSEFADVQEVTEAAK